MRRLTDDSAGTVMPAAELSRAGEKRTWKWGSSFGRARNRAFTAPTVIGASTLALSILTLAGGGVVALQVRDARADWESGQFTRIDADHEARIRSLEASETRLEGKIDLILQRLATK